MASSYPSTFDNLVNPTASDKTNSASVPHATQHSNLNDIAEALQQRVGIHTSTGGSSYPSTRLGDVLAVRSTSGHTGWGTFGTVKFAETITTSSGTASVDVTVPEHFGGFQIETIGRSESTALVDNLVLQFGSTGAAIDTSSNYDYALSQQVGGAAGTPLAVASTGYIIAGVVPGSTGPAANVGVSVASVPNYYSTQNRKRVTGTFNGWDAATSTATFRSGFFGGSWNSTAPVGKARVSLLSGANFSLGSVVRVYGRP